MNIKRIIPALLGAGILGLVSCDNTPKTNPEITVADMSEYIHVLASDSLEGRLPGTPGGSKAGDYIAEKFEAFGLKPGGDKGFYQYFDVVTETVAPADENYLKVGGEVAELKKDFTPFSYSSDGKLDAKVVFVGYGFDIEKEGLTWLDYKGIDVKDKWVLVLRNDPEIRNPNSLFIPYSGEKSKVLTAKEMGAKGILLVAGTKVERRDKLVDLVKDQTESNLGIPAFNITREFANKILKANGKTIEDLEAKLIASKKAKSFTLKSKVSGASKIVFEKVATRNVIGIIEGSDPKLKEEYIVVGGHYDHLGWGGKGTSSREPEQHAIHYGADDNASGIAGILEMADKLNSEKSKLKRSVIVIAFGAEEIGTIGSKYFTMNPTITKDKISAMVNLDMIGRLKPTKDITVSGVGTSKEGEELLNEILKQKERDLVLGVEYNGFGASDHANFYVEDIPVFFFNTGAHEDYHTPRDVVELINFEGMLRVTDYAYDLTEYLINMDGELTFQEAGPKGRAKNTRGGRVKLGIMPNFGKSDNNGLRVDGVTKGSAAQRGGVEKGDVIVAIAGKEIHNIYEYMSRMGKIRPGQTINVDVMRNNEKKILIITIDQS
ncbi:MAG: M20/M25/M40 family metallo-hydrolase [Flavobacteriales bacterium]|nr:M20/M25/M40 family metallo-hydrolase [Flavobacteriales bacterium]